MKNIQAVLFDLDGTLVDTAPDLLRVLNQLRNEFKLPEIALQAFRSMVSFGSKIMLTKTLGIEENHPDFKILRQRFLDLYQKHLADSTQLFPHVENVLTYLEQQNIPWGIVTNKLTRHTLELLKILQLDHRASCIVCGDSLPTYKPDPAPILYACQLLKFNPKSCLYVGDSITDVMASKAAGTTSVVALYGYIGLGEDPYAWEADAYVHELIEILKWL
ncbi:MAG: phosphoglycolate phosphatase [Gammaproteobacteria bacterium RIFCSPHIGHO2_12_FULL_37_14]|nr:MAG: phosphoglycolate phosphatase [Gammaproteobacteria bacterium RIFCSPHIGHO2_12_FULL_37_14]